jgi:hypothetical protein
LQYLQYLNQTALFWYLDEEEETNVQIILFEIYHLKFPRRKLYHCHSSTIDDNASTTVGKLLISNHKRDKMLLQCPNHNAAVSVEMVYNDSKQHSNTVTTRTTTTRYDLKPMQTCDTLE